MRTRLNVLAGLLAGFLVLAPAAAQDGRNLFAGTVQNKQLGASNKPIVNLVATSNVALTGTQTIDGIAGSDGDTILDTAQSTGSQNGPWIMHSGAWLRPDWWPAAGTLQPQKNNTVRVLRGSTYGGSTWYMSTAPPITIDTTATSWSVLPLTINATTTTGGAAIAFSGSASDLVSGTVPNARFPALGGADVSCASGNGNCTIASSAVTNAKSANMANSTFKCRTTAGTGAPEDCTQAQATALLNNVVGDSGSGGTKGIVPAPAAGDTAAAKFLKADGTWQTPAGGGNGSVDIQAFTASGTWTAPAFTSGEVFVYVIGPGGGGGSGGRFISGTGSGGGCSGGSGGYTTFRERLSVIASPVSVSVGTGGTGGAANAVDGTSGTNGADGSGASSFGTYATANAGTHGNGGTTASCTAGTGGSAGTIAAGLSGGTTTAGVNGVAGSAAASAGATGTAGTGNSPAAGGAGGGITTGNVAQDGGPGGAVSLPNWAGGTAGTAGGNGSAPANQGISTGKGAEGGPGGGGGGASISVAAGSGGNGGRFGASGGGGGASRNTHNSGAGGNGANGVVLVVTLGQ